MNRNSPLSIWHSRSRLGIVCASLSVLLALLNIFSDTQLQGVSNVVKHNRTFADDMDYVLETLQYMYDLQNGRAEIRSIVEKPKKVQEYWRCRLKEPEVIFDHGWLENDGIFLYSATYDRRANSLFPLNHAIQVLVMSYRSIPSTQKIFCNIRDMKNGKNAHLEGIIREIWQRAWDPRDLFYVPNLITCPIPRRMHDSENLTIELTLSVCSSSSLALRVNKRNTPKSGRKGVAVCVKGMDFMKDISKRFVEWIEAQYLMGADTITVYTYFVSNETQQVLDHYGSRGMLNMVALDLPGESPNQNYLRSEFIWRNRQQKRRHELIPYNDCLYRHIDTHEYILIVDIDEVVVPLRRDTWIEMLHDVIGDSLQHEVTSISIRNAFKFPTAHTDNAVPAFMYMLRNRRMSERISKAGDYGKSFTSTKSVATVFNHFALHRLHANVSRTIYAKKEVALKLHYKERCPIES
uniref:Glycosyltransferase family 92 protein n=2 Tax=Parascaris TaxID=6254 RepID=A0A915BJR2_PARUN